MIDLSQSQEEALLAHNNITLISHLGADLERWFVVRTGLVFGLLLNAAALLLCWFWGWNGYLFAALACTATSLFLLLRFVQAAITFNLQVWIRMRLDYDHYTLSAKTDRSKTRTRMALH